MSQYGLLFEIIHDVLTIELFLGVASNIIFFLFVISNFGFPPIVLITF